MSDNFAKPVSGLGVPALGNLDVAAFPTAGQGLALGANGRLPAPVGSVLPGARVMYASITSPVTVSSVTEAAGTTIISGTPILADGFTTFRFSFFTPYVQPAAAAGANVFISLFVDTGQVGRIALVETSSGTATEFAPCFSQILYAPAAGSRTFTITAFQSGGNGVVGAGPYGTGTYVPAFFEITRI